MREIFANFDRIGWFVTTPLNPIGSSFDNFVQGSTMLGSVTGQVPESRESFSAFLLVKIFGLTISAITFSKGLPRGTPWRVLIRGDYGFIIPTYSVLSTQFYHISFLTPCWGFSSRKTRASRSARRSKTVSRVWGSGGDKAGGFTIVLLGLLATLGLKAKPVQK